MMMINPSLNSPARLVQSRTRSRIHRYLPRLIAVSGLFILGSALASPQAITIDTKTGANKGTGTVDRRFAQITPTSVTLDKSELDPKTRQELIRVLQSEQGFAMRPFPMGHKGLTLEANGKLNPAGEAYLEMATTFGICAKPGDRVVLSDIKIEHNKIIFDLNGGPDLQHRFLRHISLGGGPVSTPVISGNGEQQPTGARLTLEFKGKVPELTGSQVKALLAPLVSFDVKTPIQAFVDTLPAKLKEAILSHDVWVGMTTDMVLFAKGQPQRKVRETQDQMPFEEWIYGAPPEPVEFVRINGNRVIRVEIAKVGEQPLIMTTDQVEGLMRSDGSPVLTASQPATHTIQMGDVQRNPDTQEAAPPPTLTAPGEKLPDNAAQNQPGAMKPVEFPTQKPDDYPDVAAARRADQAKAAQSADQKSGDAGAAKPAAPAPNTTTPAAGQGSAAPAPSQTTPSTPPADSTQPH